MRLCYRPRPTFLLAAVVLCAAATSPAQTQTTPSSSTPGQAIPGTLGVSPFAGSVPAKLVPGVMPISLQEAIDRGLKQNLGLLLSNADIRAARGQRWEQLSALLPHVTAAPYADVSQINLRELGISFSIPGFNLPPTVRFSYFDARVNVDQSLFDWKSINATRAATHSLKSAEYTYKDARDLVVLAVGYTYLQDGLRAKVELQTRQQQLIQARNAFAIQKLTVARVIGLAPGQVFDLSDKSPYQPFEGITVDEALKRAYASRSDYRAALSETRAAEFSRKAAVAGYFPSLSFSADYGAGGTHPSTAQRVFDVRGTLNIPIFQGGSVHGEVLQADSRLEQSRERLENLRAQIDSDVRTALLNLQSSAEQVEVARSNINLAEETLVQSRDRFSAGVADTVEVVQSQELVASAHEQFISSLYSYNFAKISLARAVGVAEEAVKDYFKGK